MGEGPLQCLSRAGNWDSTPKGHMESLRVMEAMRVNAPKEGPSSYPPIFSPGTNTILHSPIAGAYGSQAMDRSGNQRMSLE